MHGTSRACDAISPGPGPTQRGELRGRAPARRRDDPAARRFDCTTDTSAPQCADLTPVTTCDWNNGDGSYTAVFGYRNDSSKTILVGIGSNNQFSPSSGDRGQITSFPSGSATSSFTVRWDGSPLTWKLATKTLTTSSSGTQCPAPPVPALGGPWILIGFLVVSFLVIVMAWRDRGAPPRSPQPQPLPVPAGSDPR